MNTIEKIYVKMNSKLNKLDEDGEGLPNFDSILEELDKLEILSDDDNLLLPFIVKSATSKELYEKIGQKYTKITYKKYLEFLRSLTKEEIIEYLFKNRKYTSYNNMFEKMWMDSFIQYKINKSICPGLIQKLLNPTKELEFKLFCDCLLKKKGKECGITITSNPVTLTEYLSDLKARGKKVTLVKAMDYLQTAGSCDLENNININTTTLSMAKFLSFEFIYNIKLLQTIYHEFMHAKNESIILDNFPFYTRSLYKMAKTRLILHKAHSIYDANHDYFEIEIAATEEACKELIKDLDKLGIKHKDYYIEKLEETLAIVKLRRYHEYYDFNDELFDKLLAENLEYFKVIPGLNYEYDKKTGKRKEIPDLIIEKMRFKAGLENRKRTEKLIGENNCYLNEQLTEEEINELFDDMIYKKVMSYEIEEFEILYNGYGSSMTALEIKRIIDKKVVETNKKIDDLVIISYADYSYKSSMYKAIKELEKIKKYQEIIDKQDLKNQKIKRRI